MSPLGSFLSLSPACATWYATTYINLFVIPLVRPFFLIPSPLTTNVFICTSRFPTYIYSDLESAVFTISPSYHSIHPTPYIDYKFTVINGFICAHMSLHYIIIYTSFTSPSYTLPMFIPFLRLSHLGIINIYLYFTCLINNCP
jgi:hypothetical protein